MSMVIVSGNIDISVGSLIGVLATVQRLARGRGRPIDRAWLAPLVIGVAVMACMARSSPICGIPSIVVTLGMLSILKGGLISVTGGDWITDLPPSFQLAQMRAVRACRCRSGSWCVLTVAAALWMRYCAARPRDLCRRRQCRGGAALPASRAERTVMMVFAIHGFFAGIAAFCSRPSSA